jgi:hypothetical protein
MNTAGILPELPKIPTQDRDEIIEPLWRLEEVARPTKREKALLNEAQISYDANPAEGTPWSEVEARLHQRSRPGPPQPRCAPAQRSTRFWAHAALR